MALVEGILKVLSVALKSNFRPCLARKKNDILLTFMAFFHHTVEKLYKSSNVDEKVWQYLGLPNLNL